MFSVSLFTGLAVDPEKFALMVIDEGCWERAVRKISIRQAEITAADAADEPRMADPEAEECAWTELYRLRGLVADALMANGAGPFHRQRLVDIGLTRADCASAAVLEAQLRVDPGLRPRVNTRRSGEVF